MRGGDGSPASARALPGLGMVRCVAVRFAPLLVLLTLLSDLLVEAFDYSSNGNSADPDLILEAQANTVQLRARISIVGHLGDFEDQFEGDIVDAKHEAKGWIFNALSRVLFDDFHYETAASMSSAGDLAKLDATPTLAVYDIKRGREDHAWPGNGKRGMSIHDRTMFSYTYDINVPEGKDTTTIANRLSGRICVDGSQDFERGVLRSLDLSKLYPYKMMSQITSTQSDAVMGSMIIKEIIIYENGIRQDNLGCPVQGAVQQAQAFYFMAPDCPARSYSCEDGVVECTEEEAALPFFCKCSAGYEDTFILDTSDAENPVWIRNEEEDPDPNKPKKAVDCITKKKDFCPKPEVEEEEIRIPGRPDAEPEKSIDEVIEVVCDRGFEIVGQMTCIAVQEECGKNPTKTDDGKCIDPDKKDQNGNAASLNAACCEGEKKTHKTVGTWSGQSRCVFAEPNKPPLAECAQPTEGVEGYVWLESVEDCITCTPGDCHCSMKCDEGDNYVDVFPRPDKENDQPVCTEVDLTKKCPEVHETDRDEDRWPRLDEKGDCRDKDNTWYNEWCCEETWGKGKPGKPRMPPRELETIGSCAGISKPSDCYKSQEAEDKPCCWNPRGWIAGDSKSTCRAFGEGIDKAACARTSKFTKGKWEKLPKCRKSCHNILETTSMSAVDCQGCLPGSKDCKCDLKCKEGYEHLGGGSEGKRTCYYDDKTKTETFGPLPVCAPKRTEEPPCPDIPDSEGISFTAEFGKCEGLTDGKTCSAKCRERYTTLTGRVKAERETPTTFSCKKEELVPKEAICSEIVDMDLCLVSGQKVEDKVKPCCWSDTGFGEAGKAKCRTMGDSVIGTTASAWPTGQVFSWQPISGCTPKFRTFWEPKELPKCYPTCQLDSSVTSRTDLVVAGCKDCAVNDKGCPCRITCKKSQGYVWTGGHAEGSYMCKYIDGEAKYEPAPICRMAGEGESIVVPGGGGGGGDDDKDDDDDGPDPNIVVSCGKNPVPLDGKCMDGSTEVAPACCFTDKGMCGSSPALVNGVCKDDEEVKPAACCKGPIYQPGCGKPQARDGMCFDTITQKQTDDICCKGKETCGAKPVLQPNGKCLDAGNANAVLDSVCCGGAQCGLPVPKEDGCVDLTDESNPKPVPSGCCKDACGKKPIHFRGKCIDVANDKKELQDVCCGGGHPTGGLDVDVVPGGVDCGTVPTAVSDKCVDLLSGSELAPACCTGKTDSCGKQPVLIKGVCVEKAGETKLPTVCCEGGAYDDKGCGASPKAFGNACKDGDREVPSSCCDKDCEGATPQGEDCVKGGKVVDSACCKNSKTGCGKYKMPTTFRGKCVDMGSPFRVQIDSVCCKGGHPSGGYVPGSVDCGVPPPVSKDDECMDSASNPQKVIAPACCFDNKEECGEKPTLKDGKCTDATKGEVKSICCQGTVYVGGCGTPKAVGGKCVNLADNSAEVPNLCCKDVCGEKPEKTEEGKCIDKNNGDAALEDVCCAEKPKCGKPKPTSLKCIDTITKEEVPSGCCKDVCGLKPTLIGDSCFDMGDGRKSLEMVCCRGGHPDGGTISPTPSPFGPTPTPAPTPPSPSPTPLPAPGYPSPEPMVVDCGTNPSADGDKCLDISQREVPPACCFNGHVDTCGEKPVISNGECFDEANGRKKLADVCCTAHVYDGGCGTPRPFGNKCVNIDDHNKEVAPLCCKDHCGLEPKKEGEKCVDAKAGGRSLDEICCKGPGTIPPSCGNPEPSESPDDWCVDVSTEDHLRVPAVCCKDKCGQRPSLKEGVCVDLATGGSLAMVCCRGGHPTGGTGDVPDKKPDDGGIIPGLDCGKTPQPKKGLFSYMCVDTANDDKEVAPACCKVGNKDDCGQKPQILGATCRDAAAEFKRVPDVCCAGDIYDGSCGQPEIKMPNNICIDAATGSETSPECCKDACKGATYEDGKCMLDGKQGPGFCCTPGTPPDVPPGAPCGTAKLSGDKCVDENDKQVRSSCCKDLCLEKSVEPVMKGGECVSKSDETVKLDEVCCKGGHPTGGFIIDDSGPSPSPSPGPGPGPGPSPNPAPAPNGLVTGCGVAPRKAEKGMCLDADGAEVGPRCCFADPDVCGKQPEIKDSKCVDAADGDAPKDLTCCQGDLYDGGCGHPKIGPIKVEEGKDPMDGKCVDTIKMREVAKMCCQDDCGFRPELLGQDCLDTDNNDAKLPAICCKSGDDGDFSPTCGEPKLVNQKCVDISHKNVLVHSSCCRGLCGVKPVAVNGRCVDKGNNYKSLDISCCGGSDPTGGDDPHGGNDGSNGGDGINVPGSVPSCDAPDTMPPGVVDVRLDCIACKAGAYCKDCNFRCGPGWKNILEAPITVPTAVESGVKQCISVPKVLTKGHAEGKLCTAYTKEEDCLAAVEEGGPCCFGDQGLTEKGEKCLVRGSPLMTRAPTSCTKEFEGKWEPLPKCHKLCDTSAVDGLDETVEILNDDRDSCVADMPGEKKCTLSFKCKEGYKRIGGGSENTPRSCTDSDLKIEEPPVCRKEDEVWQDSTSDCDDKEKDEAFSVGYTYTKFGWEDDDKKCKADSGGYKVGCKEGWSVRGQPDFETVEVRCKTVKIPTLDGKKKAKCASQEAENCLDTYEEVNGEVMPCCVRSAGFKEKVHCAHSGDESLITFLTPPDKCAPLKKSSWENTFPKCSKKCKNNLKDLEASNNIVVENCDDCFVSEQEKGECKCTVKCKDGFWAPSAKSQPPWDMSCGTNGEFPTPPKCFDVSTKQDRTCVLPEEQDGLILVDAAACSNCPNSGENCKCEVHCDEGYTGFLPDLEGKLADKDRIFKGFAKGGTPHEKTDLKTLDCGHGVKDCGSGTPKLFETDGTCRAEGKADGKILGMGCCMPEKKDLEDSTFTPVWKNLPTCRPGCQNDFKGIVKVGGSKNCADCTADVKDSNEACCAIVKDEKSKEPVCVQSGHVWYGGETEEWRQCADKVWGCYHYLSNDHVAENKKCSERAAATKFFPDKDGVFWLYDEHAKDKVCGTCYCCMRTEAPVFVPKEPPVCGPDVKTSQVAMCEAPTNPKFKGLVVKDGNGNANCDKCKVKYDGGFEDPKNCDCTVSCPAGTVEASVSFKCEKTDEKPVHTPVLNCELYNNNEAACLGASYRDGTAKPCCWVPLREGASWGQCIGMGSPLMTKPPAQCTRMWGTAWKMPKPEELPTCTPICKWDAEMEKRLSEDFELEFPQSCADKKAGETCEVKCKKGFQYAGGTELSAFKCTASAENPFEASFPDPPQCAKEKPPEEPCDVAEALKELTHVVTEKACKKCSGVEDCKTKCGEFKCAKGYAPDPKDEKGSEGFKKCIVEMRPKDDDACTRHNENKYTCMKSMDSLPDLPTAPCCFMPVGSKYSKSGVCARKGSKLFARKRPAGPIVCADATISKMEDTMPKCVPAADLKDIENIDHLNIPEDVMDKCKNCAKGAVCKGCKMKCKPDEQWFGGKKEEEDVEIDDDGNWLVPICYQKNLPICTRVVASNHEFFVPGASSEFKRDEPGLAQYPHLDLYDPKYPGTSGAKSTMCENCFAGDKSCCQMKCHDGWTGNPSLSDVPCELVVDPNNIVDGKPAPVTFDLPERKCEEIDKWTDCIGAQEDGQPCCWRDHGYRFSKFGKAVKGDNPSCLPMGSPRMYRFPSFRANRPEGADKPFMCGIRQKAVFKTFPKCEATCGSHLKNVPGLKKEDVETCEKCKYEVRKLQKDLQIFKDDDGKHKKMVLKAGTEVTPFTADMVRNTQRGPGDCEDDVDYEWVLLPFQSGERFQCRKAGAHNKRFVKNACCFPDHIAADYIYVRQTSTDFDDALAFGFAKASSLLGISSPKKSKSESEPECKCELSCAGGFQKVAGSYSQGTRVCRLDADTGVPQLEPPPPTCKRGCEKIEPDVSLDIRGCDNCLPGADCMCNVRCAKNFEKIGGTEGPQKCEANKKFNDLPRCAPKCEPPTSQGAALDTSGCTKSYAPGETCGMWGSLCKCQLECKSGFKLVSGREDVFVCKQDSITKKVFWATEDSDISNIPLCMPGYIVTVIDAKTGKPLQNHDIAAYYDTVGRSIIGEKGKTNSDGAWEVFPDAREFTIVMLGKEYDFYGTESIEFYEERKTVFRTREEMESEKSLDLMIVRTRKLGTRLVADGDKGCRLITDWPNRHEFNAVLQWNDIVNDLDLWVRSFECGIDAERRYNCGRKSPSMWKDKWTYSTGCRREDTHDWFYWSAKENFGTTNQDGVKLGSMESEQRACRALRTDESGQEAIFMLEGKVAKRLIPYPNVFSKWVWSLQKKMDLLNSRLDGPSKIRQTLSPTTTMITREMKEYWEGPQPNLLPNVDASVAADYDPTALPTKAHQIYNPDINLGKTKPPRKGGDCTTTPEKNKWKTKHVEKKEVRGCFRHDDTELAEQLHDDCCTSEAGFIELDVDNRGLKGPETVTFKNVPPGRYQIAVTYFQANSEGNIKDGKPTVRLAFGDKKFLCEMPESCKTRALLWQVADIHIGQAVEFKESGHKRWYHKVDIYDEAPELEPLNPLAIPTFNLYWKAADERYSDYQQYRFNKRKCTSEDNKLGCTEQGSWWRDSRGSWVPKALQDGPTENDVQKICFGECKRDGLPGEYDNCLHRDIEEPDVGKSTTDHTVWHLDSRKFSHTDGFNFLFSPDTVSISFDSANIVGDSFRITLLQGKEFDSRTSMSDMAVATWEFYKNKASVTVKKYKNFRDGSKNPEAVEIPNGYPDGWYSGLPSMVELQMTVEYQRFFGFFQDRYIVWTMNGERVTAMDWIPKAKTLGDLGRFGWADEAQIHWIQLDGVKNPKLVQRGVNVNIPDWKTDAKDCQTTCTARDKCDECWDESGRKIDANTKQPNPASKCYSKRQEMGKTVCWHAKAIGPTSKCCGAN